MDDRNRRGTKIFRGRDRFVENDARFNGCSMDQNYEHPSRCPRHVLRRMYFESAARNISSFNMADDESSSTSDDSLDVTSVKFDPMKALYSTKMQLANKKAPIYDNICKFEGIMTGLTEKSKTKDSRAERGECSRRRFLPHQEPVPSRRIAGGQAWHTEGKNVLVKMQKTLGPLGMLHSCMESRTRVKVYTRNARGIRGHVEAYVAAFDKHWNLALEDCLEVWTRNVKRKTPALGAPSSVNAKEDTAPKVVVKKIEGKRETLERHVPQMLLRGEQIAIIVKIN